MALAQRGSMIASLLLMNEQVEKISPEKAYTDSEISNAATDRLDAMMDWLSKAATQRSAATPVVERETPHDETQASRIVTPDSLNPLVNPVQNGDTVRFADGSEWVANNGWTGPSGSWTLLQGRKEHPTIKAIDSQVGLIAAIAAAENALAKPAAPVASRETPPDAPQQPAKLPPKSFRKSQTVKIKAFDADSGKLVDHEVDADTALNSLQADIDALEAFRACIAGG